MNKEALKYFLAAAIAAVLTVINIIGMIHDRNAASAAEEAKEAAKRVEETAQRTEQISAGNSKKLDRNYQRWDEFAKQNPNIKVPPSNGEKQ